MVAQKAFTVGGPKCPVVLLEKMIAKRQPSVKMVTIGKGSKACKCR